MDSVHSDQLATRQPDGAEVRGMLYRGSFAALLRVLIAIPVYLLLTPFTLHHLGADQFAVWSFSAAVIGIVNLADLGFKSSLLYHCANHWTDRAHINNLFGACIALYTGLWLLLLSIAVAFASRISVLLGIPASYHEQGQFVVIITAISFGLRFVAMPYQAVIESRNGVGFSQNVLLCWLVLTAVATLVLLPLFPGVYVLGWIAVGGNAFTLAAFVWRARFLFPWLRLYTFKSDLRAMRSLISFGIGVYVATIMISMREPVFKTFLSHHYGLTAVADFEIAFRFCTQIISAVISPLLGTFAAAALLAKQPEELLRLLRPLCGFTLLLLPPMVVFLLCFSDWLLPLWIKDASDQIIPLLPFMFSAFALYYLVEILYQSLLATGMSNYSGTVQVAVVAVLLASLFALHHWSSNYVIVIGGAMLSGFAVFVVINLFTFKTRFGRLPVSVKSMSLMLMPTLSALMIIFPGNSFTERLLLYAVYFLLHLLAAVKAGIVTPLTLWRQWLGRRLVVDTR